MAQMVKVKTRWSGFQGSPGWTNFYFRDFTTNGVPTQADADGAVARTQTFWQAIQNRFPTVVSLQVQSDVEVLEDTDGKLVDVRNVATQPPVLGTNTIATYSGPVGMVITWRTASVHNGRRARGRTFLVPTSTAVFQADGTIEGPSITTVQNAANALAAQTGAPDLGVWARPVKHPVTKAIERVGAWYPVTGATVPDLAAVLRSRRD